MKDKFGREIEFAPQVVIEQYYDLVDIFLKEVFDVEGAWISDESSLYDFPFVEEDEDEEPTLDKIKRIYEVDVSDIEKLNLVKVLERIKILTGR